MERTGVDIEGKRAGRRREEENEKEVTERDGQTKPNETKKRGAEEGKKKWTESYCHRCG